MYLSAGFWSAMLGVAFIMWIIKMVWRIDKNVKSMNQKLDNILVKKNDSL